MARERIFATLKEVLEYLQGPLNRKIGISKLRQDSASRKFSPCGVDGWAQAEIDRYATTLRTKPSAPDITLKLNAGQDGAISAGIMDADESVLDLASLKMKREIEKIEAQTRRINFDNAVAEGKYMPKNDVYRTLASRIVVLHHALSQALKIDGAGWVRRWAREEARDAALKEYGTMVDESLDRGLAEMAAKLEDVEVELVVKPEHDRTGTSEPSGS